MLAPRLLRACAAARPLLRGVSSVSQLRDSGDGVTACGARGDGVYGVYVTHAALTTLGGVAFVDLPDDGAQLVQGAAPRVCSHAVVRRL